MKHILFIILSLLLPLIALISCQENRRRYATEVDSTTLPKDHPALLAKDTAAKIDTSAARTLLVNIGALPGLTTLSELLQAAAMDSLLNTEGPYTLLAPNNEAWIKLPGGTLQNLSKPESKAKLSGIIKNHIIAGDIKVEQLKPGTKILTLQGDELTVITKDSLILLEDAHGATGVLIQSNIASKNGSIHIIDAVLMPKQ
jgi:uncharacterized surface protein with fasciclin (FAS1) repeats